MEPVQEETQVEIQADATPSQASESKGFVDRGKDTAVSTYGRSERWVRRNPRKTAIWTSAILLFLVSFLPALSVPEPHVALSGEPILVGGWLTNSLLTTFVVDLIIIGLALLATTGMKVVPGRWQNFVEMLMEYLYSLSESVAGRGARQFFPWVVTIFIFVVIGNWIGLVPGVGSIVVHQEPDGGRTCFVVQSATGHGGRETGVCRARGRGGCARKGSAIVPGADG